MPDANPRRRPNAIRFAVLAHKIATRQPVPSHLGKKKGLPGESPCFRFPLRLLAYLAHAWTGQARRGSALYNRSSLRQLI